METKSKPTSMEKPNAIIEDKRNTKAIHDIAPTAQDLKSIESKSGEKLDLGTNQTQVLSEKSKGSTEIKPAETPQDQ